MTLSPAVMEARRQVLAMGGSWQARRRVDELRALAASTGRENYLAEAAELEAVLEIADGCGAAAASGPSQCDLFGGAR